MENYTLIGTSWAWACHVCMCLQLLYGLVTNPAIWMVHLLSATHSKKPSATRKSSKIPMVGNRSNHFLMSSNGSLYNCLTCLLETQSEQLFRFRGPGLAAFLNASFCVRKVHEVKMAFVRDTRRRREDIIFHTLGNQSFPKSK